MSREKESHAPAMCKRVPGSERDVAPGHSQRGCGWSSAYKCPDCGNRGRFNTNFLGRRHVICNGNVFRKIPDRMPELVKAGVDLRREALR